MKERIRELALQAGGSHYPDVGGNLLQTFSDLMLAECIKVIKNTPIHCAITTHDLATVQCTVEKSIEILEKNFNT